MNKEINKIKRIKQAILDSTKGSKQSPKLLQKANLCYIYFTQTAQAVFRYTFLYLILKCKSFIWAETRLQIFALRLPIDSVSHCIECTVLT